MVASDFGHGVPAISHTNLSNRHCQHPCRAPVQQRKIFVGGLAHRTSTADLLEYFSRFGRIYDAVVLTWPDGNSRGFGYVTFWEEAAALSVVQIRHMLDGQQVEVKRAVPTTNKLFVGHLSPQTTEHDLRKYFEAFGTVSTAVVMMDATTGRSRGFGFVCFPPGDEGKVAINAALSKKKHVLHRKLFDVKCASPHMEIARDRDTATSDSGARTPSDDGESSSDGPASELVEGGASSASTTSSNQQRGRYMGSKPLDMNEPRKVFLRGFSRIDPQAKMTMLARTSLEPAHINTELDCEELSSDAEMNRVQTDVPAKVEPALLSAMSALVIPTAAATKSARAKFPGQTGLEAAAAISTGSLAESGGHLSFEASADFRRSLESLLKLEAARRTVA